VHREIPFEEITKSEIRQKFRFHKECVGVKLRRDSDQESIGREKYIEIHEVTVEIPSEGMGMMNCR
jgi:hypothetical protein